VDQEASSTREKMKPCPRVSVLVRFYLKAETKLSLWVLLLLFEVFQKVTGPCEQKGVKKDRKDEDLKNVQKGDF